jgi:hypothetical protein
MKLLRETIRKMILQEAAGTFEQLPEYVAIKCFHLGSSSVRIWFILHDEGGTKDLIMKRSGIEDNLGREVYGRIGIDRIEREDGPCGGAWKVGMSGAADKWGPFLYDIAIEYATLNGNGLIPDRFIVSDEAREVWDYYLNSRSDVQVHQLDNLKGELTPEDNSDDCDQTVAELKPGWYESEDKDLAVNSIVNDIMKSMGEMPDNSSENEYWIQSAMSKRYTKEPATIEALKKAGRWIEQ